MATSTGSVAPPFNVNLRPILTKFSSNLSQFSSNFDLIFNFFFFKTVTIPFVNVLEHPFKDRKKERKKEKKKKKKKKRKKKKEKKKKEKKKKRKQTEWDIELLRN